jgi:hypothetical protein
MPRNECGLDPRTRSPVGPGLLSTLIFGFFALLTVLWIASTGRDVADDRVAGQIRGLTALSVAVYALALYAYWAHYRACQPWLGWFFLMVGGSIALTLLPSKTTVPGPAPAGDEPPRPGYRPQPLPVTNPWPPCLSCRSISRTAGW